MIRYQPALKSVHEADFTDSPIRIHKTLRFVAGCLFRILHSVVKWQFIVTKLAVACM